MDSKKVDNDTGEMIVKRVSVPIGLEELMEGLAKEVLLKKPEDLYLFAAKYFSHLLLLRDKTNYKVKTVRSAQSVIEPDQKWSGIPYIVRASQKQLTRQISVRSETPSARKNAVSKAPQKEKQDAPGRKQPDVLALEGQQKYMSSKRGYRRISVERPKNAQMRERSNSNEKTRPGASIAQPVQRPRRASLKKDEKPKDQRTSSRIPTAEAVKTLKQSEESAKSKSSSEDPKSTTSSEVHSDKSTSEKIDSDTQSKSKKKHSVEKDVSSIEEKQLKSASPSPSQTNTESNKSESVMEERKDSSNLNKSVESQQIDRNESDTKSNNSVDADKRRDITSANKIESVKSADSKRIDTTKSASVAGSEKDPSDSNNGIPIEPITKMESATPLNQTSIQKSSSDDEKISEPRDQVESTKIQDQELIETKENGSLPQESAPRSGEEIGSSIQESKLTSNEEKGSNDASDESKDKTELTKASDQGLVETKNTESMVDQTDSPKASETAESVAQEGNVPNGGKEDVIKEAGTEPTSMEQPKSTSNEGIGSSDALTESKDRVESLKSSGDGFTETKETESVAQEENVPSNGIGDVIKEAGLVTTSDQTNNQKSKSASSEENRSNDASTKVELTESSDQGFIETKKTESLTQNESTPGSAKEDMKNETGPEIGAITTSDQTVTQKSKLTSNEQDDSNGSSVDKVESAKSSDQGFVENEKSESLLEEREGPSSTEEDETGSKTLSLQISKSISDEQKNLNHASNKTSTGSSDKMESPKSRDQVVNTNENPEAVSDGDKDATIAKEKVKIETGTNAACRQPSDPTSIETEKVLTISEHEKKEVTIETVYKITPENDKAQVISKVEKDSTLSNKENESDDKKGVMNKTDSVESPILKVKSTESDKESKTIDNKRDISNDSVVEENLQSTALKDFEIKKDLVEAEPISQAIDHTVASSMSDGEKSLEKSKFKDVLSITENHSTNTKIEGEFHEMTKNREPATNDESSKTMSIEESVPRLNESVVKKETPPSSAVGKRPNSTISSQEEKSPSTPISDEKPAKDGKDSSTNLTEIPTKTSSQENKSASSEVRSIDFKTTPTISISDHSNDEIKTSNGNNERDGDMKNGSSDDGRRGDTYVASNNPSVSNENLKHADTNYSEDNTLADISDEEEINGSLNETSRLKREFEHKQDSKFETVDQEFATDKRSFNEINETLIFLEKEKSSLGENDSNVNKEKSTRIDKSDDNKQQIIQGNDTNSTKVAEESLKVVPAELDNHYKDIKEKSDTNEVQSSEKSAIEPDTKVVNHINAITAERDTGETTSHKLDQGVEKQIDETLSTVGNLATIPKVETVAIETRVVNNDLEQVDESKKTKEHTTSGEKKSLSGGNDSVAEDMSKQVIPVTSQGEEKSEDLNNKTNDLKQQETKDKSEDNNLNKVSQNRDQLKDTTDLHTSTDKTKDVIEIPEVVPDELVSSTFKDSDISKSDDSNKNKSEFNDQPILPSNASVGLEGNKEGDNALDDINNNYTKTVVNTLTLLPQKLSTECQVADDKNKIYSENGENIRKQNTDQLNQETTKTAETREGGSNDDHKNRRKRSIDSIDGKSKTTDVEETKVEKLQSENSVKENDEVLDSKTQDSALSEKHEEGKFEGKSNEGSNQPDVISGPKILKTEGSHSDETLKSNEIPSKGPVNINGVIAKEGSNDPELLHGDPTQKDESPTTENKTVDEVSNDVSENAEIAKKILERNTHDDDRSSGATGSEETTEGVAKENQVDDEIIAKELLTALSQNDSAEEKDKTVTSHKRSEPVAEQDDSSVGQSNEKVIGKSSQFVVNSQQNSEYPSNESKDRNDPIDQDSLDSTISALKTGVIDRAVRDYVNTFLSKEKVYNCAKLLDETKITRHGEHMNNRTQSLEQQRNRVNSLLTKSKSVDGKDAVTSKFDIGRLREELELSTEPKSKHALNKSLAVLRIQSLWRGFIVRKNLNIFNATPCEHEDRPVQREKPELLAAPSTVKESSSDSDRPASIDSTDSTVTVVSADTRKPQEKQSNRDDLPFIEREHLLSDYQNQLLERISGRTSKPPMDLPEDGIDEDPVPFCGTTLERKGSSKSGTLDTLQEEDNSDVEETVNAPLLHTGELHDSIILPLSSKIEDPNENLKEDSTQDLKTPEPRAESPPKKLLHTGEFHDSVLLPIESLGDVKGMEDVAQKGPPGDLGAVDGVAVGVAHAPPRVCSARAAPASATLPSRRASTMAENVEERDRREGDGDMESEAATKIQAGFRGYQVRKQLKMKNGSSDLTNLKKPRGRKEGASGANNKKDLEEKSAVKIQAGVRGFLVRRRQKKQDGVQE